MRKRRKLPDIVGQTFGRLTVVRFSHLNNAKERVWDFQCSCGNTRSVPYSDVNSGNTRSCGCLQKELFKKRFTKHDKYNTATYNSHRGIKDRCYSPKSQFYKHYGGRGITMCDRWMDKENGFMNFYEDMGERPKGTTLDRVDNDGNYSPDNCKWSTRKEQANNRRSNRQLTYNGVTMNLGQWAKKLGIGTPALLARLTKWNFEDCFVPKQK